MQKKTYLLQTHTSCHNSSYIRKFVSIAPGQMTSKPQMPAVARLAEPSRDRPGCAGKSFNNVIYTKLSTFPSRKISWLWQI